MDNAGIPEAVDNTATPSKTHDATRNYNSQARELVCEPGKAKRFDNFAHAIAAARLFKGTTLDKYQINAAIRCHPDMTDGEKIIVLEAIDILPIDEIQDGKAELGPRVALLAERLNIEVRTLQKRRMALERKCLAVRCYDKRNKQPRMQGFDLAPLMAGIEKVHAKREAVIARWKMRDEEMKVSDVETIKYTPQGERAFAHIQTLNPVDESVTTPEYSGGNDAEPASSAGRSIGDYADASRINRLRRRPEAAAAPSRKTPTAPQYERSVVCTNPDKQHGSHDNREAPKAAILAAWKLSESFQRGVALEDVEALAYEKLFPAAERLIREEFREPERNTEHTWSWAVKRHGWRAIVMAIVALEDPWVRNHCKYFGWLTKAENIDLAMNLMAITRHRRQAQQLTDDPTITYADEADEPEEVQADTTVAPPPAQWTVFVEALKKASKPEDWRHWFSVLRFKSLEDRYVVLVAPSKMHAHWIEQRHQPSLSRAMELAGWSGKLIKFEFAN